MPSPMPSRKGPVMLLRGPQWRPRCTTPSRNMPAELYEKSLRVLDGPYRRDSSVLVATLDKRAKMLRDLERQREAAEVEARAEHLRKNPQ